MSSSSNASAAVTGSPQEVLVFASVKCALAALAMLFSASLVYLTCKSKTLRETFNVLIAANSACCFLYMLTFFVQFWIAASGTLVLPMEKCFRLVAVPIFAVQCQYLLYLALAIDRLIATLFPLWHRFYVQAFPQRYLAVCLALVCGYALAILATGVPYSQFEHPQKLVACSTADPVPAFAFTLPVYINCASLLCYILLWFAVRATGRKNKKAGESSSAAYKKTRRILKSILVIFLLEFFGWFGNSLARNVLNMAEVDALHQWWALNCAGLLLIPMLAMNAPVLYLMSLEYEKAFKLVFGFHFRCCKYSLATADSTMAPTAFVAAPNKKAPIKAWTSTAGRQKSNPKEQQQQHQQQPVPPIRAHSGSQKNGTTSNEK